MIFCFEFDFEDYFDIPKISIGVDDVLLYEGDVIEKISFEHVLPDGERELWIEHRNKYIEWTTNQHDHHVFIKKIFFDNIDLDQIDYCPLTHRGRFYPKYEQSYIDSCRDRNIDLPEFIQPNHYLGHNGIWKLSFSVPTALWIIKEQNPSGMHLEDTIFSTGRTTLENVKKFFEL
jgi:hypothetical protein